MATYYLTLDDGLTEDELRDAADEQRAMRSQAHEDELATA